MNRVLFQLRVGKESLASRQAQIAITVPNSVKKFQAPIWYGNAPLFLKYVSDIKAVDSEGTTLSTRIENNVVEVKPSKAPVYTLNYTYNVPQKISGAVDLSIPVLNAQYGRFDNNLTFLAPEGLSDMPAKLTVSAPKNWKIATGWGMQNENLVPKVSQLISGMIAMGKYNFSSAQVGETNVDFGIIGDFPHDIVKKQFIRVLESQQNAVGPLASRYILVVLQPAVTDSCKGTSLTNALVVNIPPKTKLEPFNFQAIGTISHELFHQWNAHYITPALEEGAYLFTEGFTNYFAVAALVQAKLVPEKAFGRFLWKYRSMLESNPRYPGADYAAIQAGLSKDEKLLDLAYTKGPFVAVLLDLALREDTGGKESLPTWFQALGKQFGGTKGYLVQDLRESVVKLTGKAEGKAAKVFDHAFLGGEKLDLDTLFSDLGIKCSKTGECSLSKLSPEKKILRSKSFSARN